MYLFKGYKLTIKINETSVVFPKITIKVYPSLSFLIFPPSIQSNKQVEGVMTHITDLPEEVLFQIYKYLEVSTLKALQLILILQKVLDIIYIETVYIYYEYVMIK